MSIYQIGDHVAVQVCVTPERSQLIKELLSFHPMGEGWEWEIELNDSFEFPGNLMIVVFSDTGQIEFQIGDYIVFGPGTLGHMFYDPETDSHCLPLTEEEVRKHKLFTRKTVTTAAKS